MIGVGVGVVVMVGRAAIVNAVRMLLRGMVVAAARPRVAGIPMAVDLAMGMPVLVGLTGLMGMAVIVGMAVVVAVAVGMAGAEGQGHAIGLASPRALPFAEVAAFDQAFHMMVVALLGQAHLLLKAQHLSPVFA